MNQESPNDDNGVYKSPNFSSHHRTPSDSQTGLYNSCYFLNNKLNLYGLVFILGQLQISLKTPIRTQRPIPPPPPPPVGSIKKEPESTDL